MVTTKREIPDGLRPYIFLGVDLTWKDGEREAVGECPFCDSEIKFSVNQQTGLWKCWHCETQGNARNFLQALSDLAKTSGSLTTAESLAVERGLLSTRVLDLWGVFLNPLTGHWCVPGWNQDGKLCQLYQYLNTDKGKTLILSPTLGHQLFGVPLLEGKSNILYLVEGVWDAMMLWEVLKGTKQKEDVLAVPGCKVFKNAWCALFVGRDVKLLYDNDHKRKNTKTGQWIEPAGYVGANKVAQLLCEQKKAPKSVEILTWGEEGFNPHYPSGYDVRDALRTFGG